MLLKNLYKSTERDILDIYRKKEALLVSDINELIRIINGMLVSLICNW